MPASSPRHRRSRHLVAATLVAAVLAACAGHPNGARYQALWKAYAAHFIDAQGRVIDRGSADQRSTSEGQAYALFFALVANQPKRFTTLLDWTQAKLAQGDLAHHLPAWLWGRRSDGQWAVLDRHPAADADVWLAYTLIEAGQLWKRPDYRRLGRALAAQIAAHETADQPGMGPVLLPGAHGFGPDAKGCYVLNPSYWPQPLLDALGADLGQPWIGIASHLPDLMRAVAHHGFAPDWARWCPGEGFGADPAKPYASSYDAIRAYLWAGLTNPQTAGADAVLKSLGGMSKWLGGHRLPPESVALAGGEGKGTAPPGFLFALLPYLQRLNRSDAEARLVKALRAARDPKGLYGTPPSYYDQNLALFALGALDGAYHFGPHGSLHVKWQ